MCVGCKIGIVQAPVYKVNCVECKIGPFVWTLVSRQDVLDCLPTDYRKSLVSTGRVCVPLLVKDGYRQWEDDAIVLVISPLLDPPITFVMVPPDLSL